MRKDEDVFTKVTSIAKQTLLVGEVDHQALSFLFQLLRLLCLEHQRRAPAEYQERWMEALPFLKNLSAHPPAVNSSAAGFMTALALQQGGLAFFHQQGLVPLGWDLLSHRSLFVQHSARELLSTLVVRSLADGDAQLVSSLSLELLQRLSQDSTRLAALNLLLGILESGGASSLEPQLLCQTLQEGLIRSECQEKICKALALASLERDITSIRCTLVENQHFSGLLTFSFNLLLIRPGLERRDLHFETLLLPLRLLHDSLPTSSTYGDVLVGTEKAMRRVLKEDGSLASKLRCSSLYNLLAVFGHLDSQNRAEVFKVTSHLLKAFSQATASSSGAALFAQAGSDKKTVKALLELLAFALGKDSTDSVGQEFPSLFHSLIDLMNAPRTDPAVFHACCRMVSQLIIHPQHQEEAWRFCSLRLGYTLQEKATSSAWEVMDTTLETIKTVLEAFQSFSGISEWVLSLGLHRLVWDSILEKEELEGYVRASALSILPGLCAIPGIWDCWVQERGLEGSCPVSLLLSDLALEDPEVFVQRAAISSLSALLEGCLLAADSPGVIRILQGGVAPNLDWEVKTLTLDLASKVANEWTTSAGPNMELLMEKLQDSGVLGVLCQGAEDCDPTVALKGAKMLQGLRLRLCGLGCQPPRMEEPTYNLKEDNLMKVEEELQPTLLFSGREEVIDGILNTEMRDRMAAIVVPSKALSPRRVCKPTVKCFHQFWTLNVEAAIQQAQASTDLYRDNLDALLDDLLAAASLEHLLESQVIDCY